MTTTEGITARKIVKFKLGRYGRKRLVAETTHSPKVAIEGRVPRISRLMALSIRINGLIAAGEIEDWAEAARLAHITRARASQIAALSLLAPDIIEELLHLPSVTCGRDPITERDLRRVAATPRWDMQRKVWASAKVSLSTEHVFIRNA